MGEAKSVRPVMLPPAGFTEQAVERGLAEVLAAEALLDLERERFSDEAPDNDTRPSLPRKRRDSGIISGMSSDDRPTLPFIRAGQR